MKEIGGYFELEHFRTPMMHEGAVALASGRQGLEYLIVTKKITKIALPYFLCDCIKKLCEKYKVLIRFYHINESFLPCDIVLYKDEWLYLVNYYGQISKEQVENLRSSYHQIIIDNTQAYFEEPYKGIDTLYSCRKFFGVSDGGFLYTDTKYEKPLEEDISFDRMEYILGRYEKKASDFYEQSVKNNELFDELPLRKMSKLTNNLLRGIDYQYVQRRRELNFQILHRALAVYNELNIRFPKGPFSYPLYIQNGAQLRKRLIQEKIYIPKLWPNVTEEVEVGTREYDFAENIVPLPCDQRYNEDDMRRITTIILALIA